jgi:DNA-binding response OmpR family regulator
VESALRPGPFAVHLFASAEELLREVSKADLDATLVVADAVSDDMTALGLIRVIRESASWADLRVLVVSRWSAEVDRVISFEHGADDFLAEPFFARELLSRVQALLRRGRAAPARPERDGAELGPVAIDFRRGRVEVQGVRVDLTHREFDLLRILVGEGGRVVPRERLLQEFGAEEGVSPRVIDTHVKAIRAKLGPARDCIQTVRGVGYRFDPERAPPG